MCHNKLNSVGLILIILLVYTESHENNEVNAKLSRVWGPGLMPHRITLPARYFFVELVNSLNKSITSELDEELAVHLEGKTKDGKICRIWTNILNRKDGSYIIRFKLYEPCINLNIDIKYKGNHIAQSPYTIKSTIYPDDCDCSVETTTNVLKKWKCGPIPQQIQEDLKPFLKINWDDIREEVIKKFDQPLSVSLCHYVVKDNILYRRCYGKYVGFKMFMDSILLSLTRKMILPNLEFFVNLGDWPLIKLESTEIYPIFSWCGSINSHDIVMPTYDITESTLENMGRVMLDMLSVQGNVDGVWETRIPKAFWRGRDSNQQRLDLITISRKYPELFNVSLTNFFFFRDQQEKYGPKTEHVSFFEFFRYKYQLAIDGTVAAYRFPYLLGGGSLVIKQKSKYYEHFYNGLVPDVHYIPMEHDLSNLIEQLNWAITNDEKAKQIAENGKAFANANLLPTNIFCYYMNLLNEFSKRIVSDVKILDGMEKVDQIKQPNYCDCKRDLIKDEL